MKFDTYIVEGTNWKCKVDLEKNTGLNKEYQLIEAATRSLEHLFGNYDHMDSVEVFELRDTDGIDYFKQINYEDVPEPALGLLTKIYSLKDVKKTNNHYVIKTKNLLENAGINYALTLVNILEKEIHLKNPKLIETIQDLMKDKIIIKYGDLPD